MIQIVIRKVFISLLMLSYCSNHFKLFLLLFFVTNYFLISATITDWMNGSQNASLTQFCHSFSLFCVFFCALSCFLFNYCFWNILFYHCDNRKNVVVHVWLKFYFTYHSLQIQNVAIVWHFITELLVENLLRNFYACKAHFVESNCFFVFNNYSSTVFFAST